ncbi:hypothetical protein TorRG33x02_037730 [Trema orientale]|uniref:Uncharacterized protein n=1 Tax=Trema orientale TaxID=63057 RepID=A0A2P5FRE4_TREOI|nr:hypothetical protein TorRG33x02_037730 [Trema orientale]
MPLGGMGHNNLSALVNELDNIFCLQTNWIPFFNKTSPKEIAIQETSEPYTFIKKLEAEDEFEAFKFPQRGIQRLKYHRKPSKLLLSHPRSVSTVANLTFLQQNLTISPILHPNNRYTP